MPPSKRGLGPVRLLSLLAVVMLLVVSAALLHATIRKITQAKQAAASSAEEARCPTVMSCEEQRAKHCAASGRAAATPAVSSSAGGGSGGGGSEPRVLVLAMATVDTDIVGVNIFVRSCRIALSQRNADVVVLTDARATGDRRDIFQASGVTEVVFTLDASGAKAAGARWTLFGDYLGGLALKYDAVMIADSTQTVCEEDPFDHLIPRVWPADGAVKSADLHTFEATKGSDGGKLVDAVKACTGGGSKAASEETSPVISGVTVGGFDSIVAYVGLMNDRLSAKAECTEEAVVNHIVRSGDLEAALRPSKLVVHGHNEGFVVSLNGAKEVTRDFLGRVLDAKRKPVAVVHRFGGSKKLAEQYKQQYPIIPDAELHGK